MKTRSLVFSIVALAFACGGNVSTGGDETSGGSGGKSGMGSGGKSGSGPGGKGGNGGAAGKAGQGGTGATGGAPAGCTPGGTSECICPGGFYGYQVCRPNGAGYGDCLCNGGGVGGCGSLDQCAAQSPWLTPECTSCACSRCLCEMSGCMSDPGCMAIAQCASKVGCSGIGCYSPQTCQFVIDQYGGPAGIASSLAFALSDCSSGAGCPCNVSGSGGAAGAGGAPAYCKCDGASVVICSDGTAQDCAPYRCAPPGACSGTCNSNAECAPGFLCISGSCY